MGRLIVIQFITLDGVVEDPDGSDRSPFGGWAMRHGPQGVAGDEFRLGPNLQHGTLLFGRRTWDHFADVWPKRSDPFSQAMNAATKVVVAHRDIDEGRWSSSHAIDEPLTEWVRHHRPTTDIVVSAAGRLSVRSPRATSSTSIGFSPSPPLWAPAAAFSPTNASWN